MEAKELAELWETVLLENWMDQGMLDKITRRVASSGTTVVARWIWLLSSIVGPLFGKLVAVLLVVALVVVIGTVGRIVVFDGIVLVVRVVATVCAEKFLKSDPVFPTKVISVFSSAATAGFSLSCCWTERTMVSIGAGTMVVCLLWLRM